MISAVIATYNCAPWLAESIDSMLGQTHPPDEIVVVDDGSTDETPAVLAPYRGRITLLAGPHRGLSAARNVGLAHARGEWIAFHDADDVALPDRLAFHQDYLRTHPAAEAVFANGERMDGGGRLVPPATVRRVGASPLGVRDLFLQFPVYFQGALVPRRAFEAAGPFDPALRVQPDLEYAFRLIRHCRAEFVDRVVFRYRWHSTNNSRDWLGSCEDIAQILERVAVDADAARAVGRRRLRARLARYYYRIARRRFAAGETAAADAALDRALVLRPLHPRYRLLRLRHGR